MRITRQSLNNPIPVAVIAVMMMMLGVASIFKLPAQLLPDIEKPIVSVYAMWPGASPSEIESELAVPIEEVLQGTPGMVEMGAWSLPNVVFFQLTFSIETDMTHALIDLISRINRMRPLPANVIKPQISMGEWGDANNTLIEYYIQQLPGTEHRKAENAKYMRDVIMPQLQSLYGVSRFDFDDGSMGGDGDQLQIIFDPYKAAEFGIDIARVPARIGRSQDISSGFVDFGRRQYMLRYEGEYDPEELADLILEWRGGLPIKLGDVATIEIGPGRVDGFIYQNGNRAFQMMATKTNGANVLEALNGIKAKMEELNATVFAERGMVAQYSFDPALYIDRSIRLISSNMLIGMFLAVFVLWLFLRQWRATFLIALAIPISLLTTFVVLEMTGRTLNVISLAGLAFATGMVLDAAIVVLENIVRLRERGESPKEASDMGATQVGGALVASTATTVAIFIPIMFLEDAEGQMFADLAMTIAIGVSVSLLVAITILPTTARFWMRQLPEPIAGETVWDRITNFLMKITDSKTKRVSWIAGLISFSIVFTVLLWPTSNYLPPVNRNNLDSWVFFPPGVSVATADKEIGQVINARLMPYLKGEKEPKVRDFYIWTFPGASGAMLSINGDEGVDLDQLKKVIQTEIIANIPDVYGFTFQRSLFGGFSSANGVKMQITSNDLGQLQEAAKLAMAKTMQLIPGTVANPQPDPNSESSEMTVLPIDKRLREVGWNRQDLSAVILALGQGVWMGEYFDGQSKMDIYLKSDRFETPEEMMAIPVQTPKGGVIPLRELASIIQETNPSMIGRINRMRGYEITVNPPEDMSLEQLVTELKTKIEPIIKANLPADGRVEYAGSAADLERAIKTLGSNFFFALILLIMIMAALFKSVQDALLVVLTIPMAIVGGIFAISIMNLIKFQPLDILGFIGFIILLGLVVNNAILLVAQTRKAQSRGLSRRDAVRQALRLRLRPIFMSTLTSIFGMMPLLVFPGEGSALYRGMAAAIVGGMSVSMIFTLVLLPSLLQMTKGSPSKEMSLNDDAAPSSHKLAAE